MTTNNFNNKALQKTRKQEFIAELDRALIGTRMPYFPRYICFNCYTLRFRIVYNSDVIKNHWEVSNYIGTAKDEELDLNRIFQMICDRALSKFGVNLLEDELEETV